MIRDSGLLFWSPCTFTDDVMHRQLLDCGGVHRLMVVTSNSTSYSAKVFHLACRVRFEV